MIPEHEATLRLSHPNNEIARFTRTRDAHISEFHTYYAAPSHARRLPSELVAEIFMLCPAMRLIFCQICSAWREIAITTARLWTSIRISVSADKFNNQMLWLQTVCDRSGTLPLSVMLDYRAYLDVLSVTPITTLVRYFPRIQQLTLKLSRRCCQMLNNFPTASLPLLESCTLSSFEGPLDQPGFITVFETAPRLRRVTFFDLYLYKTLRLPPLLTNLNLICDMTPAECLGILNRCPDLQEFSKPDLYAPFPDEQYPDSAILLQLRTIHINIGVRSDGELFFDHLTVPSLIDLGLGVATSDMDECWPHSSFMSLLSRSRFSLQRLTLGFLDMDTQELFECLQALPSLSYVCFQEDDFVDHRLLNALIFVEGGSDNLVPKLDTFLAIDLLDPLGMSPIENSFMDMVESRWWPMLPVSRTLLMKPMESPVLPTQNCRSTPGYENHQWIRMC